MVELYHVVALSGFAALVRYAQQFTAPPEGRPKWETRIAAIHAATGAFVGLLASFAIPTDWEVRYALFTVALAGYGGKDSLDFAWKVGTDAAASILSRAAQRLSDKGAMDKDPKG